MSSNSLTEAIYRLNAMATGSGTWDLSDNDVRDINLVLNHYKELQKIALEHHTLYSQCILNQSYHEALYKLVELNESYFKGECADQEVGNHLIKIKKLKEEMY